MSGVLYAAGFQVGGTNAMTATVAGFSAPIVSGLYLPGAYTTGSLDVAWNRTAYTSFSAAVKAAFDLAASSSFTVAFSQTTGKYTISRATNFTLAFPANAAGLAMAAALGFTTNKTGANTYTSDEVPRYVMLSAIGARTLVTNLQEPDDVASETVSDGGEAEGLTRKTDEFFSTWAQANEPKVATYLRDRLFANSTAWTWQQFIKHCRMTHPFVVYDPSDPEQSVADGTLHRFTAKGAAFKPERMVVDFDDYWLIKFATRDLGKFA